MPGVPDPHYVVARAVLLDALEALGAQRSAVILVGAQAIYLHADAIELAVPEFTTDADITIDPSLLQPAPEIEAAMLAGGFARGNRVGTWTVSRKIGGVPTTVAVDLMVPDAISGPGRRAARLAGHAKGVARRARGLEAALVDKRTEQIAALDESDLRRYEIAVAGPAALMIAKLHKIGERISERTQNRLDDKDALDVLRLLRATSTEHLAATLGMLLERDMTGPITREAIVTLRDIFGTAQAAGSQMAVRAVGGLASPTEIANSCAVLATALVNAVANAPSK